MRREVIAFVGSVGSVGLLLSACSTPSGEAQKPPEEEPEAVVAEAPAEAGAVAAPKELALALPEIEVVGLPRPDSPPQPPALALPEIEVVGLSERETLALLGPPVAKREEAPAKVWRYAGAECTVEVYFYLDIESNAFRALHLAGLEESTPADHLRQCLRRVYDAYRKP